MIRFGTIRRLVLPAGPILSITLIGILILSGLLYYRAVKIQRFLEPALALSQPRSEFAEGIKALLEREFGKLEPHGIRYTYGSILVREQLVFDSQGRPLKASPVFGKLGKVFLEILKDEHTRSHVNLVLVCARFPFSPEVMVRKGTRASVQGKALLMADAIFDAVPELEREFGQYFLAAALPSDSDEWVELRIFPSEQLHIEVLQKLKKYVH